VSCYVVNVASRSAPGSPCNSDGNIMLEGISGGDAAAGVKSVRPMLSSAVSQRLIQLSNDLTVSRSAPVSPQGQTYSLRCHALAIVC